MRYIVFIAAGLVSFSASISQALPAVSEMCKLQKAAAAPKDPSAVLKSRKLSKEEEEKLTDARACVKSYAAQFPGGLEAFQEFDPKTLKANLDSLRAAFANPRKLPLDKNNPLSVRMALIRNGWDREQVLLFGTYLLIRAHYQNGDYDSALSVISDLRKEYPITVQPVVWDELQERTYFTADTLRNMIASVEYMAKVRLPGQSKAAMAQVVDAYMKDRSHLDPLGNFALNPDATMFRGYCGSSK